MYPVPWNRCLQHFILKPYDHYKTLERSYQPFIILVRKVYRHLKNHSIEDILNLKCPLQYFIQKSIQNAK